MSGGALDSDAITAAIIQAELDGFEVVKDTDTTLLLDLDTPEAYRQFLRVLPVVTEHFGVIQIQEWDSKSRNRHVRLQLAESHPVGVRLALQAALGSDGVREALSTVTMLKGSPVVSLLFRSPAVKITKRKP